MLFRFQIGAFVRSCCFAAMAALGLVLSTGKAWSEDGEGLEFAPNHADVVAVVEVAKILESPAFKQIAKELPDLASNLDKPLGKKTKLTPRSLESVFVAANSKTQEFIVVLSLTEEVEIDDVIAADQRSGSTKVGEFTMFAMEEDQALCLVDESTVAIGPTKTLTAVLKRDSAPKLSAELTTAWDNVDDEQHIYVVAALDKLVKQGAGAIPAGIPLSPETLGNLKTATLSASTHKKHLSLNVDLDCTDNATANQLKGVLDVVLQGAQQPNAETPAEIRQLLKSVKSSTEDEIFTINFNVEIDAILGQLKTQILNAVSTAETP